jgi:hypothetical protein
MTPCTVTLPFFWASVATVLRITWNVSFGSPGPSPACAVPARNSPSRLGKMKASGLESGHCFCQSRRAVARSLGKRMDVRLFFVLPQGRILLLYAVSSRLIVDVEGSNRFHLRANSSLGRSALVISSSNRMRSLSPNFDSANLSCSQVSVVLSVSRSYVGTFTLRVGSFSYHCPCLLRRANSQTQAPVSPVQIPRPS